MNTLILALFTFHRSLAGGLPVLPSNNQQNLLKSSVPQLLKNKHLVFDFWREVLIGRHLEKVHKYLREDYIQHNPNVNSGMKGFIDYFSKLGSPRTIPTTIPNLVSIQAEGDFVTLSLVNEIEESQLKGVKYTTTWFDMFRIEGDKIAEHWDCDIKKP